MKKYIYLLIALLMFLNVNTVYSKDMNYSYFLQIPVLHEGRIKPLDSFASSYLLKISGKRHLKNISSAEWFAELLFNQLSAYNRPVFKINNPDVLASINLAKKGSVFSFIEVSAAIKNNLNMITKLYESNEELTLPQKQLVDLYENTILFFDISRSLSFVLPSFSVKNSKLREELNIKTEQQFSYLDVIAYKEELESFVKKTSPEESQKDDYLKEKLRLSSMIKLFSVTPSKLFKIIPPQWKKDDIWMSPYSMLENGQGSPETSQYLKIWSSMGTAYSSDNNILWEKKSKEARDMSIKMAKGQISISDINTEIIYNKSNLFYFSFIFYLSSFLLILSFFFLKRNYLIKASNISLFLGFLCNTGGILLRILMLSRAPVSNLYESIIFVSLIVAGYSLILERKNKEGVFLFSGSITGLILMFISMRYSLTSNNTEVLMAVLNTNFWLTTHVLTISVGYGCCFVASVISHLWIIRYLFNSNDKNFLNKLETGITIICLVALFFTLTGTILGGIWADQSWGRFWGWDPKENGALLLVLWLILILHGKIIKFLNSFLFITSVAFTNIIVTLAWFGVNLLNTGLHSYGFTTNISIAIISFCLAEILLLFFCVFLFLKKT